ncbi:preprotein translocase subunit SecG [bacterium]|nr:preprotein translocase subunit SecG [bacterium]
MLFGLLIALFTFICLLLVLIILIQQGKGSMGLGSLGGGTQMLFGGSGGQDIFQKITWVLGVIFMVGSLVLALAKSKSGVRTKVSEKAPITQQMPVQQPASQK